MQVRCQHSGRLLTQATRMMLAYAGFAFQPSHGSGRQRTSSPSPGPMKLVANALQTLRKTRIDPLSPQSSADLHRRHAIPGSTLFEFLPWCHCSSPNRSLSGMLEHFAKVSLCRHAERSRFRHWNLKQVYTVRCGTSPMAAYYSKCRGMVVWADAIVARPKPHL